MKECECGCGVLVNRRFVSGHNLKDQKRSEQHNLRIAEGLRRAWQHGRKGGGWGAARRALPMGTTHLNRDGYVMVKVEPGQGRWRPQHVVIVEGELGRSLMPGEVVHHIDGDRSNNVPDNLFLCQSRSQHGAMHRSQVTVFAGLLRGGLVRFDRAQATYEALL